MPVTHRGVAHEFTVVSGHVAPDNPKSLVDWDAAGPDARHPRAADGGRAARPDRRGAARHGKDAATPVAVVQEGTRPGEKVVRTRLETMAADVAEAGVTPPAIVVIGPVAGL